MGTTANDDPTVPGDTQYNLDQVMELLFTGEAFAVDEATPPVAINPFNMFIQCFDQLGIDIGPTPQQRTPSRSARSRATALPCAP